MKKDTIILGIFSLIILSASVMLFVDFYSTNRHSSTEKIGTIIFKRKTAHRKYHEQPIWELLYKDSPVYNKDKIRTSDNSLSIIYFFNGSEVELDENTLVFLDMKDNKPIINFTEGSIRTRKNGNDSDLTVYANDNEITLDNADASLSLNSKGDINISVTEGKANITNSNGRTEIAQNQTATVSSGKIIVTEKPTNSEQPHPGSYMVTDTNSRDVIFKWNDDSHTITGVEVYNAQTNAKLALPDKKSDGSFQTNLEPGEYYWRMKKGDGTLTDPNKFTIIQDSAPEAVNPEKDKEFLFFSNRPSVFFSWKGSDSASMYHLEISKDRTFSKIEHSIETKETSITVPSLDEGLWFWRVRTKYGFGGITDQLTSKTSSFSIEKSDKTSSPDLLSPANLTEFSNDYFDKNQLLFNWEQNNDIREYNLEISTTSAFTNFVYTDKTQYPYLRIDRTLPTGEYFWRVRYVNPVTGKTEYTSHAKFSITPDSSFTALSPVNNTTIPSSQIIVLRWNDSSHWNNYRVDLSKDSNFSTIENSYSTRSNFIQIEKQNNGKWFWRVIRLPESQSKKIISSSFYVSNNIYAPFITIPYDGQIFDMAARNELRFAWRPIQNASLYNIRITDMYKNVLIETSTATTSYTVNNLSLFDRGSYYFEINAQTGNSETMALSPITRRKFVLKLNPLGNPKLKVREFFYVE